MQREICYAFAITMTEIHRDSSAGRLLRLRKEYRISHLIAAVCLASGGKDSLTVFRCCSAKGTA